MRNATEFIFVYGTLRQSSNTTMARLLACHSSYIGVATMQGVLYDVGGYLGVLESTDANDKVLGELHHINDSDVLLPLLDDYEECSERFAEPVEYLRKALPITLMTGEIKTAWVYVYNWSVAPTSLEKACSQ